MGLLRGCECPLVLFAQPRGLMRVLRSIVQAFVLTVLHTRQKLPFRCAITLQFSRNDHAGDRVSPFEKLAEESFGSVFVASALDSNIQDVATLIHCSPEGMRFPIDLEGHLVHMPCVTTARMATAQCIVA